MLPPRADNDRVGTGLAWGVVFSLCFHMVLFSPQLAFQLLGQLKPAESAPEKAKEKEKGKDPNKPDAQKTPEERKKEEEERKKEEANPEAKKKSAAQQPPEPPQPELQPLLTPTPSPAMPDVEDVAIGQDDGDSMSVVIIGREDYEEHMARQSVVAQAGFRMSDAGGNGEQDYGRGTEGNAGGGGGGAPNAQSNTTTATTAGAPVAPEATQTASAPPAPKPIEEPKPESPVKPPEQAPAVVAEAPPKPPVTPTTTTPVTEPPQPAPPTPTVPVTANPEAEPNPPIEAPRDPKVLPPVEPKPVPPPPAPEPVKQPTPTVPVEPKPAPPPPVNQPPKAPEGGGIASTERPKTDAKEKAPGDSGKAGGKGPSTVPGTGGKGELKDLESPATSLTEVDPKLWKNGRLVAAQGITLKPREPRFTTLQTVSQLPSCRPPVVSLTFDRTGSCVDVFFNLPTGDPEIDGVIKNSLFFWRAAGKKIDSLKEGEKVRVTLRLLL